MIVEFFDQQSRTCPQRNLLDVRHLMGGNTQQPCGICHEPLCKGAHFPPRDDASECHLR